MLVRRYSCINFNDFSKMDNILAPVFPVCPCRKDESQSKAINLLVVVININDVDIDAEDNYHLSDIPPISQVDVHSTLRDDL